MRRSMNPTAAAVILSALVACVGSDAAVAQWSGRATASMGRGYGNLALSQSILSGTRRLGEAAPSRRDAAQPAVTPAQIDAALTFTADPQRSERIRAEVIDTISAQNPALRAGAEKAFAGDAVLKEFDRVMTANGYSSRNVADDMTVLLLVSWETCSGSEATKAQMRGARQQVLGIFLGNPALRAMSEAERQDMAERIAYHVVLGSTARQEALRSGDPARLAQVRQSAAAMLMTQLGIDLSQLRLTDKGFRKKS